MLVDIGLKFYPVQYHHDLPWETLRSRLQTRNLVLKFLIKVFLKSKSLGSRWIKLILCMVIDIGLRFYAVHHNSPG